MNFQSMAQFPTRFPSPSWEILFSKGRARILLEFSWSWGRRRRRRASRRIGDGEGKRGAEWSEANSSGRTRNEYLNRDTRRVLLPSLSLSVSSSLFHSARTRLFAKPARTPTSMSQFVLAFLLFFFSFPSFYFPLQLLSICGRGIVGRGWKYSCG